MTVLGPVDSGTLGRTMTHEHLFFRSSSLTAPAIPLDVDDDASPLGPDNLWLVRRSPGRSRDNKRLDDFEAARSELAHFLADGGGTIVEVTTRGIGPDPVSLRRLAEASGVRIVAGTGYYNARVRPPGFADRSVEEVAAELTGDVIDGFSGTDVHAGVIGELAIEGPGPRPGVRDIGQLDPGDVLLLRAAAVAQRRSGVPVIVHPPEARIPGVPATSVIHGVLDILQEAGADLGRVVVAHLDRDTWETVDSLASLGDRGVYLALDQWGYEGYRLKSSSIVPWLYPSDAQRVRLTKGLIGEGFGSRLLLSHDVCDKIQWRRHGGGGYAHILRFIQPVLRAERISQAAIDEILIANPARLLTLQPPRRSDEVANTGGPPNLRPVAGGG